MTNVSTIFGKETAKFSLAIHVQSNQTHRPSLLKELKDLQPFPIATFQTSILYIQHLIWLKNIYTPQSATSKRLPTPLT